MSHYQLDTPAGPVSCATAREALAALTPEATGIWLVNPETVDADRALTHNELATLAANESER